MNLINLDSPFKLSTFALTNAGSNVCNDVSFSVNNLTTSSCGRFLFVSNFSIFRLSLSVMTAIRFLSFAPSNAKCLNTVPPTEISSIPFAKG